MEATAIHERLKPTPLTLSESLRGDPVIGDVPHGIRIMVIYANRVVRGQIVGNTLAVYGQPHDYGAPVLVEFDREDLEATAEQIANWLRHYGWRRAVAALNHPPDMGGES